MWGGCVACERLHKGKVVFDERGVCQEDAPYGAAWDAEKGDEEEEEGVGRPGHGASSDSSIDSVWPVVWRSEESIHPACKVSQNDRDALLPLLPLLLPLLCGVGSDEAVEGPVGGYAEAVGACLERGNVEAAVGLVWGEGEEGRVCPREVGGVAWLVAEGEGQGEDAGEGGGGGGAERSGDRGKGAQLGRDVGRGQGVGGVEQE